MTKWGREINENETVKVCLNKAGVDVVNAYYTKMEQTQRVGIGQTIEIQFWQLLQMFQECGISKSSNFTYFFSTQFFEKNPAEEITSMEKQMLYNYVDAEVDRAIKCKMGSEFISRMQRILEKVRQI